VSGGEACGYGILTPRENLWLFTQFYGLKYKEAAKNIDQMLDVVGLTEYKHTKMYELSTGMRQKINFSRGFVTNPRIVFLDEPTLGMDVTAARAIRAFLRDWMAKDPSRTIILTTHYMAEADELCDRIAIIDKGKILACDTPERLKAMVATEVTMLMETSPLSGVIGHLKKLRGVVNSSDEFDVEAQKTKLRIVLEGEKFVPDIIDFVKSKNASIHLLRISEPTLEDVFIKLVGRGLSTDTTV
ncbi:ABC transporter ATP-binding protein, partial [bacterium]|nr:ABC transporter ATP-binding protein [bacterium]